VPETTDEPPPLDVVVRLHVLAVCEACNWNLAVAAVRLGVSTKTVYNHLHRYLDEGHVERLTTDGKKLTVWRRVRRP
jgi:transposase